MFGYLAALRLGEAELQKLCLIEMDKHLRSHAKRLRDYPGFSDYDIPEYNDFENQFVMEELSYDREEMRALHQRLINSLTAEQRQVHDEIMNSVSKYSGHFFFLYGYGGTGKTY